MTYWRMKLRDGTHGEDMWGPCRNAGLAAITYPGITWVDLRLYSKQKRPPEWNQIGSPAGKGSIAHFAWEIRGGDAIYIGDSATHQIVGMGYATAKIGELAYRFDAHSPIVPLRGDPWCHLIDVDWDTSFTPFGYKDRAPQTTVLGFKKMEIQDFEQASHTAEHRNKGLGDKDIRKTFLLETAYPRYTPAAQRLILRKHSILSNCFRRWLENKPVAEVSQERQQMDITFKANRRRY